MTESTTLLVLSGVGVPPYSARGIKQTLEPIRSAANIRRNVNGRLRNLSKAEFKKFQTTINGSDVDPPADMWPGDLVTVDCVAERSYLTIGGAPERDVVEGSSRTEGEFTFYRPRLEMMVTDIQAGKDEYPADTNWTLRLEEV